jgi:hypothetical protein
VSNIFNYNNYELIDKIIEHQALAKKGEVHPITCGNDSSHWMWPKIENDVVILICNNCNYKQEYIPAIMEKRHES